MKVAILTGTELRHTFFRMSIAADTKVQVVRSYCEKKKELKKVIGMAPIDPLQEDHLKKRLASEEIFFAKFIETATDRSHPRFIENEEINSSACFEDLQVLKPDVIISYGCSIIKDPLLSAFPGRFINVHLGLSPYYRGSGTNFWALVNRQPELVGVTFMHIDKGVDTGDIIHQLRARVVPGDDAHSIGNRLISDMVIDTLALVKNIHRLEASGPLPLVEAEKVYRKRDFTLDSVKQLYVNFENGMIENYLTERKLREARYPIRSNPVVQTEGDQ